MIYNNINQKLLSGAEKLADVVGATLGPKGRNVIVNRLSDNPIITKDGVTVARNVVLEDTVENMAVRLIKEVGLNVVKEAGDGTTTATVLAHALLKEGSEFLKENPDYSPIQLKNVFDKCKDQILEYISKNKVSIDSTNQGLLAKVATISANNDVELGKVIYEAITLAGEDGTVKVKNSSNTSTFIDKVEGVNYLNGYISPYFVNNPANAKTEFQEPLVFLIDKKLDSADEIEKILMAATYEPILIIAEDYSAEATSMLVVNNKREIRKICAVRAAEFGDYRKSIFQDLSLLTSARIITALDQNYDARQVCGKVKSCIVTKKDHTLILDPNFVSDLIPKHVEDLKQLHDVSEIDFDRQKIRDRIAKLTNGIVTIHVGAKTELELHEKIDRVEDALLATQAAIQEGVVPGAGLTLVKASYKIFGSCDWVDENYEAVLAFDAAMCYPFKRILQNAYTNEDVILTAINAIDETHTFLGYDISKNPLINEEDAHENMVDMFEVGIIDPARVTRAALENAVSIAGMLLTTDHGVEHFDIDNPYLQS